MVVAVFNVIACAIAGTIFFQSGRMATQRLPINGLIIVGFATAFSLSGAVLTALQATWIMFGSEIFECDDVNLTMSISLLGLKHQRRFSLRAVESPRVDVNVSIQKGGRFVQRRLAFDYLGRKVYSYSLLMDDDLRLARAYVDAIASAKVSVT
jgi:hypothetical protein